MSPRKNGISPLSTRWPMSNTTLAFSSFTGTSMCRAGSLCASARPPESVEPKLTAKPVTNRTENDRHLDIEHSSQALVSSALFWLTNGVSQLKPPLLNKIPNGSCRRKYQDNGTQHGRPNPLCRESSN